MMTERCRNCEAELRMARMPRCDLELVEICEGCGRIYLGHPEEMLIQFPASEPRRQKPKLKDVDMYVN
jgi:hypothetical protein